MDVNVQRGSIEATQADVIIVNLFEGVELPAGATGAVDKALNGTITDVIRSGDYRGKLNEISVVYSRGALPAKRVIVVGLGNVADFNLDRVRQAAAMSARRARELGCKSIATVAHGAGTGQIDAASAAQAVVEGVLLGLYEWREHRNAPRERGPVESLTLVEFDESKLAAIESGAKAGEGIAAGVNRARDLSTGATICCRRT
jgi:leucyl aminopeptidase